MQITPGQRKKYFLYVSTFGESPIRELLSKMTGETSIKNISPGRMNLVLDELSRQYRGKPFVVHQKQIKPIRTREQKIQIQGLLGELGYDSAKYHELCRFVIEKNEPAFEPEAVVIIRELEKLLAFSRKFKQKQS